MWAHTIAPSRQKALGKLLNEAAAVRTWQVSATADDVCRRHACSATGASKLWGPTFSPTLDNSLSWDEFVTAVRLRFRVHVSPSTGTCCFCGLVADPAGQHALSCMSGGDPATLHNQIRDLIFHYCKRGALHPVLEASHFLPGLDAARRRPADVLAPHPAPLLDPDGSMHSSHKPLALDFAVMNVLGPGHWDDTWRTSSGAAEAYIFCPETQIPLHQTIMPCK